MLANATSTGAALTAPRAPASRGRGAARPWGCVLDAALASSARHIALEVARRIVDRPRLAAALAGAARQTRFPEGMRWQPHGLAQGNAGLALLCGHLDTAQPEAGWDRAGHGFLRAAVAGIEQHRGDVHPGAFAGLAGLAFAAWSLSRGGARYRALLESLDHSLAIAMLGATTAQSQRATAGGVWQFDAISGLAGTGAYLVCRRSRPVVADALDAVLRWLIHLTAPTAGGPPRWHTPPHLMADPSMIVQYPCGNLNFGLAHGIPGPLALMSIAYRDGVDLPGLPDAIAHVAHFIADHRIDGPHGVDWPTAIALDVDGTWQVNRAAGPSRTAWCYGSPGVARSLWLAGDAIGDRALKALAVEAMAAALRRPVPERLIDSPTLCHGVSGLLAIVLRFVHDDEHAHELISGAQALTRELLALYDPDRPLGYVSIEPGCNRVDHPGLLDGAAGVALALLAAATSAEPGWDRLFLLS